MGGYYDTSPGRNDDNLTLSKEKMQHSRIQKSVEDQPLIRKWAGRQIHVDHNGEKLIAQMD